MARQQHGSLTVDGLCDALLVDVQFQHVMAGGVRPDWLYVYPQGTHPDRLDDPRQSLSPSTQLSFAARQAPYVVAVIADCGDAG